MLQQCFVLVLGVQQMELLAWNYDRVPARMVFSPVSVTRLRDNGRRIPNFDSFISYVLVPKGDRSASEFFTTTSCFKTRCNALISQ